MYLSYVIQPLDVDWFLSLKCVYGYQVEICKQLGRNYIDKVDFLETFKPT